MTETQVESPRASRDGNPTQVIWLNDSLRKAVEDYQWDLRVFQYVAVQRVIAEGCLSLKLITPDQFQKVLEQLFDVIEKRMEKDGAGADRIDQIKADFFKRGLT